MDYLTIVCDLKNSRQLKDRENIQYKIIDMLKEANLRFAAYIAAPFIITLGDEWQGLLKYPSNYSEVIDFFHSKLGEVDFYCGIGIGDVTVHNFELTVNQLDGPSFYHAREAVKLAKQYNHSLILIQ